MRTNNYTLYGLHDDNERYFWVSYMTFVLVSSLIGDSIVLVASIKYNAIKLHKSIVVLVQHIAVCDLLTAVIQLFPTTIAVGLDKWVYGDLLCGVPDWICKSILFRYFHRPTIGVNHCF